MYRPLATALPSRDMVSSFTVLLTLDQIVLPLAASFCCDSFAHRPVNSIVKYMSYVLHVRLPFFSFSCMCLVATDTSCEPERESFSCCVLVAVGFVGSSVQRPVVSLFWRTDGCSTTVATDERLEWIASESTAGSRHSSLHCVGLIAFGACPKGRRSYSTSCSFPRIYLA
jgi:hypothetical protein